jgi:hypothetical protein
MPKKRMKAFSGATGMSPWADETSEPIQSELSQSDQGRQPTGVEEQKQREIPKAVFSMSSLSVQEMRNLATGATQTIQEAENPAIIEALTRQMSLNRGL